MSSLNINNPRVRSKLLSSCVSLAIDTSGDNPFCHCILQISAVRYQNGKEIGNIILTLHPYDIPDYDKIKEVIPIEVQISTVDGLSVDEAFESLEGFIGDDIVLIHDAFKVLKFFWSSRPKHRFLPLYVDTFILAKKVYKNLDNYDIEKLSRFLGITTEDIFTSNSLSRATGKLMFDMMIKLGYGYN